MTRSAPDVRRALAGTDRLDPDSVARLLAEATSAAQAAFHAGDVDGGSAYTTAVIDAVPALIAAGLADDVRTTARALNLAAVMARHASPPDVTALLAHTATLLADDPGTVIADAARWRGLPAAHIRALRDIKTVLTALTQLAPAVPRAASMVEPWRAALPVLP